MTLQNYIKQIVDQTNLPADEQDELYWELYDHLFSLQQEFIAEGKSEAAATKLAIEHFGEASILGKKLKKSMQRPIQKYLKWISWGLFMPYSFILISKLLLMRFPYHIDTVTLFLETGNWNELRGLINIVPFQTIVMYVSDPYNVDIVLTNTLGNIIIFIPFGFFIPLLFTKVNNIKAACKLFITTILLIELLQLVSLRGVFDIDDILLNVIGAVIGYITYQQLKKLGLQRKNTTKMNMIPK